MNESKYTVMLMNWMKNKHMVVLTYWRRKVKYDHTNILTESKIYLTNRFHVAMRLFSNRSQMTSNCNNKKVAHEAIAKCVTNILGTFWCPLWSITEQTHGNLETICFIQLKKHTTSAFYFKMFLNYSKAGPFPLRQTRKKAIWRNVLSIQNEAISLVAIHWFRKITPLSNLTQMVCRGMKLTAKAELNC